MPALTASRKLAPCRRVTGLNAFNGWRSPFVSNNSQVMKRASKKTPESQTSHQPLYLVLGLALGLAGFSGIAYVLLPTPNIGSPAIGGSFTLIDQDGRVVTSADLAGLPHLVFFGYTQCTSYCPAALADISAVLKELGPDKKIAALFITVDPEHDTPSVLKDFLESFDSRIIGLTGAKQQTEAVAKAFRVYAQKVAGEKAGEYTVDHTGAVYLMDKRGKFVTVLDLQKPPREAARELQSYL